MGMGMGMGRDEACEVALGGYGGGGTVPELPGMLIERSSGGGWGGYAPVLSDLSSEGCGLLAVGVRSRSCAAIFPRWVWGGGRSKELRLTRGGADGGGLVGTFFLYISTVRSTSRLTWSNLSGCSMQKHVSNLVLRPSFLSFCTCVTL